MAARLLIAGGFVVLFCLIMLRLFAPTLVVDNINGLLLSYLWVFLVSLGVLILKDVPLEDSSAWHLLGVMTSLIGGPTTWVVLGLAPLGDPPSWKALIFLLLIWPLCLFALGVGWWRLLTGSRKVIAAQSDLRPVFLVVFTLLCVLLVVLKRSW